VHIKSKHIIATPEAQLMTLQLGIITRVRTIRRQIDRP